ncbi:hypothetical protein BLA60_29645 [Actinophytocola xinjiangensis]|uniref:HTH cro/C1-type domain-containing protein n=1 Tax=Actinophytocola xinjiangensis TaxID=485602 RepID=A0A7Z1AW03_9PSEU|nr:helix-turn-helix domain-containing protein [Actinophytocola xinjiangensis]OLF07018.1 hypothetical protein BLA60_29645 [Actinophytocola xinjiangensis]
MTVQFTALLRRLRREAGLTQEHLAERTGLAVRTIGRLESGASANPQLDTVRLLADGLGLEPDVRATFLTVAGGQEPVEPEEPDGPAGPVEVVERRPESALERLLADAADDLAHAVHARLKKEEELRRIHDPFPLPVRWQPAPDGVMDQWANIRRVPHGEAAPLDLAGRLPEIVEIYRRIPSGRLVVLGRAGSGKSVLAARFVLDLLRTRGRCDAVPVALGIASWNPTTTTFRDWLVGQLLRDHPGLAARGPNRSNLATALVDADRILPVLDGFDELAVGQHRRALDALNTTDLPLLLTSRPGEYRDVASVDALTAAAAIRLTDLVVADLVDYLPRTTRRGAGGTVWDPVLAQLRDHPERPASTNLRTVLTTPLMVGLARAVYSDATGPDPAELLDTTRFGSQHEIEDHLLSRFIPTVYLDQRSRWDAGRARAWLGYLARHLDRLGTHDLAWWRLGVTMRRRTRMTVVGLVCGLAVGLSTGAMTWLVEALNGGSGLAALLTTGGYWLGFGLATGLAHGVGITLGSGAFEPSRVQLRASGGSRHLRARFGPRALIGLGGGVGLGLVLGLVGAAGIPPMGLPGAGFLGGLAAGTALGTLAGLGWGLLAGLETTVDLTSAVGPADTLRTNRLVVVVEFLGLGLVLGLAHLLMTTLTLGYLFPTGLVLDLVLGPVIGLAIGIGMTAWGQWLIFARIWLPLTGRLPWSVAAFLDDACRRGVLRQVGAVYQFRHARLQAHLANTA